MIQMLVLSNNSTKIIILIVKCSRCSQWRNVPVFLICRKNQKRLIEPDLVLRQASPDLLFNPRSQRSFIRNITSDIWISGLNIWRICQINGLDDCCVFLYHSIIPICLSTFILTTSSLYPLLVLILAFCRTSSIHCFALDCGRTLGFRTQMYPRWMQVA